jgi:hypothetical protein
VKPLYKGLDSKMMDTGEVLTYQIIGVSYPKIFNRLEGARNHGTLIAQSHLEQICSRKFL